MFKSSLVAFIALSVFAAIPSAQAVPRCMSGKTLTDYIGFGADGCTLDDKIFSNFKLALGPNDGSTTVPTAAQIMVTPIKEPRNPGLRFTGDPVFKSPPAPSPPQPFFYSYRLSFTVRVRAGGNLIDDASLEFAEPSATGNANATIQELLCIGGLFESKGICNPGVPQAELNVRDNTNQTNQTFDHVIFGSYDVVDTQTLILVEQGTPDRPGAAQFKSLTMQFSEVPEPSSVLLFASGLFGLLMLRRRGPMRVMGVQISEVQVRGLRLTA